MNIHIKKSHSVDKFMTYLHKTGPRLLTITKITFSLFTGSLGQQIDEF